MKTINIESTHGINLAADFHESDSDKVIIMLHGFGGDRHHFGAFDKLAVVYNEAGFNVLCLDMSGHGESSDAPIEFDQWEDDLVMVVSKVYEMGMKSIGLLGFSLGGLTALRAAAHAHAIALMSPVTDALPNIIEEFTKQELIEFKEKGQFETPVESISRDKILVTQQTIDDFNNVKQDDLLVNIEAPVLVFHSDSDTVVPIAHSRQAVELLFDAELETIKGDGHRLLDNIDLIADKSTNFFVANL